MGEVLCFGFLHFKSSPGSALLIKLNLLLYNKLYI